MEAFGDPFVREVTIVCGSQMGKTEVLLNIIGHRFDDGPRVPTLVIQPTAKAAKSFSDDRLRKLLHSSKNLLQKLEKGQRDRIAEKFLAGVALRMAWAGSATELASHPGGLVLLDERDRMDSDVAGEGDPTILAKARGKNYPRFKLAIVSTPTIEDASPIQAHFDDGSMEFWEWQCPDCDEWHRPQLKFLHWPQGSTPDQAEREATYACPACGTVLPERAKSKVNEQGRYTQYLRNQDGDYEPDPDAPEKGPSRSYWVSGLCSPWMTFGKIARELVGAYRSFEDERIQGVINTYGGEVYRTRGDAPDWEDVQKCILPLPRCKVPPGAQVAVLGADVQKDCIYYVVRMFGFNLESWLVDHGQLFGATEFDDVWLALGTLLKRPIQDRVIQRAFIDSGYKPGGDGYRRPDHQVYRFCHRFPGIAYPTKGRDSQDLPVRKSQIDITIDGKILKNGLSLWHLDTDYFKTAIHSRVRWPAHADTGGWHLHTDTDEDYCRQIVAEEVVTKASGRRFWIARRSRPNHYLDAEVNALACAHSLNLQHLPEHHEAGEDPKQQQPRQRSSHFVSRGL